jgi:hypothetical protein
VLDSILENIKLDSEKAAKKGREASGVLYGVSYKNNGYCFDVIRTMSVIGDGSKRDLFERAIMFPFFTYLDIFGEIKNEIKFKKLEKNENINLLSVAYHSHDNGTSWSKGDLEESTFFGVSDNINQVLYRVGVDIFEAVNYECENITVVAFNNSK